MSLQLRISASMIRPPFHSFLPTKVISKIPDKIAFPLCLFLPFPSSFFFEPHNLRRLDQHLLLALPRLSTSSLKRRKPKIQLSKQHTPTPQINTNTSSPHLQSRSFNIPPPPPKVREQPCPFLLSPDPTMMIQQLAPVLDRFCTHVYADNALRPRASF